MGITLSLPARADHAHEAVAASSFRLNVSVGSVNVVIRVVSKWLVEDILISLAVEEDALGSWSPELAALTKGRSAAKKSRVRCRSCADSLTVSTVWNGRTVRRGATFRPASSYLPSQISSGITGILRHAGTIGPVDRLDDTNQVRQAQASWMIFPRA